MVKNIHSAHLQKKLFLIRWLSLDVLEWKVTAPYCCYSHLQLEES